jgi:hypothetical protein
MRWIIQAEPRPALDRTQNPAKCYPNQRFARIRKNDLRRGSAYTRIRFIGDAYDGCSDFFVPAASAPFRVAAEVRRRISILIAGQKIRLLTSAATDPPKKVLANMSLLDRIICNLEE